MQRGMEAGPLNRGADVRGLAFLFGLESWGSPQFLANKHSLYLRYMPCVLQFIK